MKLTDSEQKLLDEILDGVEDVTEKSQYLKVYDENFEELRKDVDDSVGTILANAAISIAEQKRLLQTANTPKALESALRLIAVTGGNLINAGAHILSWMGKQLPHRDSLEMGEESGLDDSDVKEDVDDAAGGISMLSWLSKQLPKRDSTFLADDCDLVFTCHDSERGYAIIKRKSVGDYAISCGFDGCKGEYGSVVGGFKSADAAFGELGRMLKQE